MKRLTAAAAALTASAALLAGCVVLPPFVPDEDAYIEELNEWTSATYGMTVQQLGWLAADDEDPLQSIVDHGYLACTFATADEFADSWGGETRELQDASRAQWEAASGNLCPE